MCFWTEIAAMRWLVSIPRQTAAVAAAGAALAVSLIVPVAAQLPLPAIKDSGEAIYPAFEGWYANPDGSFNLLLGYYNRNQKQMLDIPVGPNNRVEPGGPDMGQPTYFHVRRGWGVFAIKVPKDFGSEKRFTWTIVANGKTASVPVGLIKDYQIEPFKDTAEGNTPPVLKFSPTGKTFQGPPLVVAHELTGTVGQPVTLEVIITDDMHKEEGENPAVCRPHPAPRPVVAQASRSRRRDLQRAAAEDRRRRQDDDDGDVLGAGRVHAARPGQRQLG